jgi:hypothetical protein
VFLFACGESPSLGDLAGDYDLGRASYLLGSGEDADCVLPLGTGGASVDCERSVTERYRHESLSIDVALDDDSVSADVVYVTERERPSVEVEICTTTISGEALRSERGEGHDGEPFAVAVGRWTGTVSYELACDDDDTEEKSFTFEAYVYASTAEIAWTRDDDREGSFSVVSRGDTLEVDGVDIPKL